MNRGGNPLQRRAGLVRRPLKAGKGLERKPKLQAVDGDKPKPAKRKTARDTGPTRKTRAALAERSGGVCEMCGQRRATDVHHRHGRLMGVTNRAWINELSNLLHADRECHVKVTDTAANRAEYEANGWLLREGQHPAEVEVLLSRESGRDFYLLDDAGGVQLALFPAPVDAHPDDLDVTRPDQTGDQAA